MKMRLLPVPKPRQKKKRKTKKQRIKTTKQRRKTKKQRNAKEKLRRCSFLFCRVSRSWIVWCLSHMMCGVGQGWVRVVG